MNKTYHIRVSRQYRFWEHGEYVSLVTVTDGAVTVRKEKRMMFLMMPKPRDGSVRIGQIKAVTTAPALWMSLSAAFGVFFCLLLEAGLGYVLSQIGLDNRNSMMVMGGMCFLIASIVMLVVSTMGRNCVIECQDGSRLSIPAYNYLFGQGDENVIKMVDAIQSRLMM